MNQDVSRARTRNTRKREKEASRPPQPRPLRESPWLGLLIGLLLWLTSAMVLCGSTVFHPTRGPETYLLWRNMLFLLGGILGCTLFLRLTRPRILTDNRLILLLCLLSLLSLLAAKALLYLVDVGHLPVSRDVAHFLLPFALAPLLTTLLLDGVVAIPVGAWSGLAMSFMAGGDNPLLIFFTALLATLAAASSAHHLRTRQSLYRAGFLIGFTQIICVLAGAPWSDGASAAMLLVHQSAGCLASGVLAAMFALLVLPAFESLFKLTTDVTLLELSDMGHPLLQRLAMEAPGTYHHSLVVASLAHAASNTIGANSLLARVCAYYHDIGKLTKPDFFVENIHLQKNPHDELPPSMSTLIITAHVKEGISLAMYHKLPPPVIDIIREHHGNSLISYFHHKARTQLELSLHAESDRGPGYVPEVDFRYQGPTPRTRESGIICLADAVEAASRSLERVTPTHIETLVRDVVQARVDDGQLDHCELTLRELAAVRRSFGFTLTNMLHSRMPYPKDEDRDKQPASAAPGS